MNEILEELKTASSKGTLLEEVLEDVLLDLAFLNVRRQRSGAQYGYDLVATKQGKYNEIWKFECKNLSGSVSIDDIAPKLVWHLGDEIVDRFIIVSVSASSAYLDELFERVKFPLPIEIWTGEFLTSMISKSPRALKRLQLGNANTLVVENIKPIIYDQTLIIFDAFSANKVPYSYDYFYTEKGLTKAFTEQWIQLVAAFCNNSKTHDFICSEINVITLRYQPVEGRIFRQGKPKGFVEPTKVSFAPSIISSKPISIFDKAQLFTVKADKDEFFLLELNDEKTTPGYYELVFEAKGRQNKKDFVMYSAVFPLHVAAPDADLNRLTTFGKFYDTPAEDVLNMPSEQWEGLKNMGENRVALLGPSFMEIHLGKQDDTWKIKVLNCKPVKDHYGDSLEFDPKAPTEVYYDLGTSVREKQFSEEDAFKAIFGSDWENVLSGNTKPRN